MSGPHLSDLQNKQAQFDLRNKQARELFMLRGGLERLQSKVGSTAVFRESRFLEIVRVEQISVSEDGVRCVIRTVPTAGLDPPPGESPLETTLFASWAIFSVSGFRWHASYVPWDLFVNEELVQEIVALAAAEASEGRTLTFMQAWGAVIRFENRQSDAGLLREKLTRRTLPE